MSGSYVRNLETLIFHLLETLPDGTRRNHHRLRDEALQVTHFTTTINPRWHRPFHKLNHQRPHQARRRDQQTTHDHPTSERRNRTHDRSSSLHCKHFGHDRGDKRRFTWLQKKQNDGVRKPRQHGWLITTTDDHLQHKRSTTTINDHRHHHDHRDHSEQRLAHRQLTVMNYLTGLASIWDVLLECCRQVTTVRCDV